MTFIPEIRDFIVENFLFGDGKELNDNTSFFEKGIIDSTGIMELIAFLEDRYNIHIADEELVADNFSSLENINKFLKQKINLIVN